jgi:C4-dicarboxylate transporter/malic acid transport protein
MNERKAFREIVRQFTPNWFTVTMGTGILSLALNQFPIHLPGIHTIAIALWLLNIALFAVFLILYTARWIVFTGEASRIFSHSTVSMFFGAIPMALATIVNGCLVYGVPMWGNQLIAVARVLWWADVALAVFCGVAVPFLMFTQQEHVLDRMTAIWLLPIVAAEVSAASGAVLAPFLPPTIALRIVFISYALWAFSVPLALSILTILLLRLVLHKLPPADMAATSWLALGPIGTGALGLISLGVDALRILPSVGFAMVAQTAYGIGLIGSIALLGYGMFWLLIAILITSRYLRQGMLFNIGWWGFTFPIGVYTLAILAVARQTNITTLFVLGGALIIALTLLWLSVAARTIQGAWSGTLFHSPCLVPGAIPEDRNRIVGPS